MKILRGDDPENLRAIVEMIRDGYPVVLPTETVYGLAVDALKPEAVRSIFEIKGRPKNDPLIVHVADIEQVEDIAFVPPVLKELAEAFWPGPLTVVLRKKEIVPDIVTSGLPTVAVRVPSHPLFREILQAVNRPLAAPSANPFGYVSPTRAEHVISSFDECCPIVLDGGPTDHGIESTILSLDDPAAPTILRLGPLSAGDLAEILGSPPAIGPTSDDFSPQAPGNMTRHYSPSVPLKLHPDPASIRNEIETCGNPRNTGVLLLQRSAALENWPVEMKLLWLSEKGNLREAASRLYDVLRKLDADPLLEIVHCETPPNQGIGAAINDRLRRAAAQA